LENFNVNLSRNWISLLFSKLTEEDSIIYPLKKKKTVQKYDSGIVKSDKATKIIWLSNNLFILEHMSHEELAYVIKIEKDEKLLKRHMFIQFLYLTKNIKKSSLLMGISEQNGRNWIDLWNQNGEKGLIIQWGGGRPSLISKDNWKKIRKYLKDNKIRTIPDAHNYILKNYGVNYSIPHLKKILKKTKIWVW
jgi:transposase